MNAQTRILASAVACFALSACFGTVPVRAERMQQLGSALTKLSTAVEATVRYEASSTTLSDTELLQMATQHDPGLLAPFADYLLRVQRTDRHVLLLVCTKSGDTGLLEDAGCTTPMDQHLWSASPPAQCSFTLSIPDICRPAD